MILRRPACGLFIPKDIYLASCRIGVATEHFLGGFVPSAFHVGPGNDPLRALFSCKHDLPPCEPPRRKDPVAAAGAPDGIRSLFSDVTREPFLNDLFQETLLAQAAVFEDVVRRSLIPLGIEDRAGEVYLKKKNLIFSRKPEVSPRVALSGESPENLACLQEKRIQGG